VTGHQAPIFRRSPELAGVAPTSTLDMRSEKPWFVPLGIFVARRESFDFIVRDEDPALAKMVAFGELPLFESGWDEGAAQIKRAGTTEDGFPIWKLTRG
jgi:hypothetical protein